jgi:hypothetical protein
MPRLFPQMLIFPAQRFPKLHLIQVFDRRDAIFKPVNRAGLSDKLQTL